MWPDDYSISVSRESLERLEQYQALLFRWQKAINLVSSKTLQDSGERHFADSAQLINYIGDDVRTVMDWGSGAGFPGAVLSILRPDIDFTLVESDERKCQFIRTVSRETSATMRIENRRIEDVVADATVVPDLITARALKPLKILMDYAYPLIKENPDLCFLLLKGENVHQELEEALEIFSFDVESHPSVTNPLACVLLISNVRLKS